jgi:glyoxylase-like metal-dependent hydrolase (beta-lactamase superfamily II)
MLSGDASSAARQFHRCDDPGSDPDRILEVLEDDRLTPLYILITHAHPDHYFGLGPIAEAFPKARVIALPSVARTINKQFFGKIEHWEKTIGITNTPRKAVNIEPLTGHYFELEGQRIEVIPEVMGDLKLHREYSLNLNAYTNRLGRNFL